MDVLQLDVSGRPQAWITTREAAVIYACDGVAWTLGDPCQVLRGGWQRLSGRQSRIEVHSIIAVRGAVPSRVVRARRTAAPPPAARPSWRRGRATPCGRRCVVSVLQGVTSRITRGAHRLWVLQCVRSVRSPAAHRGASELVAQFKACGIALPRRNACRMASRFRVIGRPATAQNRPERSLTRLITALLVYYNESD